MTLLSSLVETSARVAGTSSRLEKVREMAQHLRQLAPREIPIAITFLSGQLRQGRLGIGHAMLRDVCSPPAATPALTLTQVDDAFSELAAMQGTGAAQSRRAALHRLFGQATAQEQDFLVRLLMGELRQGALRALMLEAVVEASQVDQSELRRAVMSSGGLVQVAQAVLGEGAAGLARFSIRLMQPVLPMLSQSAADTAAALSALGTAALEWKLDGARIQAHKAGEEVRIYTRSLKDVTPAVPEIAEAVRALPSRSLILDGEAIALRGDGTPHSFQTTMRRFGRRLNVDEARKDLPLSAFFFDCLLCDDAPLTDRPAAERFRVLEDMLPAGLCVPRLVTADPAEAERFLESALERGHEGIMAKSLAAPYEAGRRGTGWFKIKRANTLDLVVLAVEWGNGRRSGKLSNLHLGARDPASGGHVMLGKTFKGMTDEMLEWQTEKFLQLETGRDAATVYVRPEVVVEIAFNELQASTRYPGGLALRFARVKGYRPDKRADEADTMETVRALYQRQTRM